MSDDDARGQRDERWVLPGGKRVGRRVSSGIGVVALLSAAAVGAAAGATPALAATVQSSPSPSPTPTTTSDAAVAPTISSMAPGYGPDAGGTQVTIDGSGFGTTAGTVTIGGTEATIDSWTDGGVVFTTPPGDTGAAPVIVTTADGTSTDGNIAFIYQAVTVTPTITGISPDSGPATGGTQITITGTDFGNDFGTNDTTVSIGGNLATVTSWSDTSILATTPAGTAGQASVVLSISGESSNSFGFTYTAVAPVTPVITSENPGDGPPAGGTRVTLTGTGFGTTQGTVTLGGVSATIDSWTDTSVVFTTPPGADGPVGLVLTNASGLSDSEYSFDYVTITAPEITSISPTGGPAAGGTQVTVTGTGFGTTPGQVYFAGFPASVDSWTDTSIVVTAPAGSGTETVEVIADGVNSNTVPFAYTTPPVVAPNITGLSPATGPEAGGTQVTITGTGFGTAAGTVTIGENAATVDSWTDTSVVITTPPGAAGQDTVTLSVDGASTTGPSFTYTAPVVAPTVTALSPAYGVMTGGSQVTITGSGFGTTAGTVTFGGAAATILDWTDTSILVQTPAGTAGPAAVIVAAGGVSASGPSFTYQAPVAIPIITGFSPASSPDAGGEQLTITGTSLGTTAGSVTIGGKTATVVSWTDTSVVVTVPAGGPGTAEIVLTTASGSQSDSVTFTYDAAPPPPPPATVSAISPASGSTAGGEQVTITGTGFGTTAGTVTFAGKTAPVVSWADTSIVVTDPAGTAGPAAVIVTAGGVPVSGPSFTYQAPVVIPPPSITGISPNHGPTAGGERITITGTNFGTAKGSVTIGGKAAAVDSWASTKVIVTVPADGPGTASVVLTADATASNSVTFTYQAAPPPPPAPAPHVTRLSPDHGPQTGGTRLTISGANFGRAKGSVTVGGKAAAIIDWTSTEIVVTVPVGSPGAVSVIVTADGRRSNYAAFTYDRVRVVTPTKTSLRLVASADPETLHGKVTFTAIVTAATGRETPAGSVRFTVDGKPLGNPVKLVNGRAVSAAITTLAAGDHRVVATFVPAAGFQASSASLTEVVQQPRRSPGRRSPWYWFR